MNYTPGPWSIADARSTKVDLIDTAKGAAVGEIVWVDVRNPADARLIAAAPDLLRELEFLRAVTADYFRDFTHLHPEIAKALQLSGDAIKKAGGEL